MIGGLGMGSYHRGHQEIVDLGSWRTNQVHICNDGDQNGQGK